MFNNNPDPNNQNNPNNPNNPALNPFGGGGFGNAPYQQPVPEKKSFFTLKKALLGCAGLVVICVACIGIVIFGLATLTKPAAEKGDQFLEALKQGDYDAAYAMGDSKFQESVGTVEEFQTKLETLGFLPDEWSFNNGRSISTDSTGTIANLEGSVTYLDGSEHTLKMDMVKIDDTWYVRYFEIDQ